MLSLCSVLEVDEISVNFILTAPIELLDKLATAELSTVFKPSKMLHETEVIKNLCNVHDLTLVESFVDFVRAYNRKYLLVRDHDLDYVLKYVDQLPLKVALRQAAIARNFEVLDHLFNTHTLWCAPEYITLVCCELLTDPEAVKRYFTPYHTYCVPDGDLHNENALNYLEKICEHAGRINVDFDPSIFRDRGCDGGYDFSSSTFLGATGCGHWDLARKHYEDSSDDLTITECAVVQCRFDLLCANHGEVTLKPELIPNDFPVPVGTLSVNLIWSHMGAKYLTIELYDRMCELGCHLPGSIIETIGENLNNLELFDRIVTTQNVRDEHRDCVCGYVLTFQRDEELSEDVQTPSVNSSLEWLEWLRAHKPDYIDNYHIMIQGMKNDMIRDIFSLFIEEGNCRSDYSSYEVRKLIEYYPWLYTKKEYMAEIKEITKGDAHMRKWLKSRN